MITTENASSWLVDSPVVQAFSPRGGKWAGSNHNEKLQLQPGDVVWIGKQPAQPEVPLFHLLALPPFFLSLFLLGWIDGAWTAKASPG